MAVFDALRHLSAYLYDAHMSEKHHLADLYELVQYAGNILPRVRLLFIWQDYSNIRLFDSIVIFNDHGRLSLYVSSRSANQGDYERFDGDESRSTASDKRIVYETLSQRYDQRSPSDWR
jgi:hypothetical protein